MAKKEKQEDEIDVQTETDVVKLSKLLIKSFNKDEEKTGKIAWNLDSDLDNPTDVKEFISTGNTLLDYCIANKANGGVPVGKLTEIVGEEASGKSLLAAHLAANCQKKGGVVAYIDTENAMHPEFAKQIGVDLKKMIYLQPGTVEEVEAAILKMILMTRQKAPNQLVLIVWDSIAGTPTKCEIEGELDLNMNQQLEKAKVLSKMMRRITGLLGKERICLVFTNQLKTKIGVMYGDPMTTPGGKAVPYHASVRIRLTRRGTEKAEDDAVMGVNTAAKLIKNRLGPPLRKCHFFISFSHGIEDEESWFEYLHEQGEIEKRAGFCYAPSFDQKFSFRESQWAEKLKELPELKKWALQKLDQHLIVKYGGTADPESLMEVEQTVEDLIDPK
jgi:recombination protein RecA